MVRTCLYQPGHNPKGGNSIGYVNTPRESGVDAHDGESKNPPESRGEGSWGSIRFRVGLSLK